MNTLETPTEQSTERITLYYREGRSGTKNKPPEI